MLQVQHFCSATEGTNLSPCCKQGCRRALQRETDRGLPDV